MDFSQLLKIGAEAIERNDDPATSGMDIDRIASALSGLFDTRPGSEATGIAVLIQKAMASGLGEVVGTWIGQGSNAPLDAQKVTELIDEDRIARFARELGVEEDSAKKALADALPVIVDRATPPEEGMLDSLLEQIGGMEGISGIFGRMFR